MRSEAGGNLGRLGEIFIGEGLRRILRWRLECCKCQVEMGLVHQEKAGCKHASGCCELLFGSVRMHSDAFGGWGKFRRDELFEKFESTIDDVQQKSGFKNILLEKKLQAPLTARTQTPDTAHSPHTNTRRVRSAPLHTRLQVRHHIRPKSAHVPTALAPSKRTRPHRSGHQRVAREEGVATLGSHPRSKPRPEHAGQRLEEARRRAGRQEWRRQGSAVRVGADHQGS